MSQIIIDTISFFRNHLFLNLRIWLIKFLKIQIFFDLFILYIMHFWWFLMPIFFKTNKMCVFTIQETFVLSSICQKCQGTQIKAFLCFKLKGDEKGRGTVITKLLQIGLKWCFLPMVYKNNVSCLPKIHILCLMTTSLFARFWRDLL